MSFDIDEIKRRAGIVENIVIPSNQHEAERNALAYATKGIKAQYDELMQGMGLDNATAKELVSILNELTERAKRLG
jgi:hypothetical protein